MVARSDITKCKYFPEEIPEAIVTTSGGSPQNIASYSGFSPFVLELKHIMTGQTPGQTLRVNTDGGYASIESPLSARPDRMFMPSSIMCWDSLDLEVQGSAFATYCAFVLRVTQQTVFEKIKHGRTLDDREQSLSDEFELPKKLKAGMLRMLDVPQWKKMVEVARTVTVAANGSTRVGRNVQVKSGEKAVLLGIAVDSAALRTFNGGPGANDTLFNVDRDKVDTGHVSLDCISMPSINWEVPCYVPALDKLDIYLQSVIGVTNLNVRYRYGVADLTILEKIRWGRLLTKDEKAISDEFQLPDSVAAGIL